MTERPYLALRRRVFGAAAALGVALLVPAASTSAATYPTIAAANASPAASAVTVANVTISSVLNISATNGYNLDVQDASGGAQLFRFPTAAFSGFTPAAGQVVSVTGTNSPFSGNPEFSNVGAAVSLVSATSTFVPAFVTAGVLNASNGSSLLGETVTLTGVTIAPAGTTTGTTFVTNGTYSITDVTGASTIFIPSATSYSQVNIFAGQTIPTSPVTVTGYVDYFSTGGIIELYPTAISGLPEPASLGLLAGIGGLLTARRRAGRA